MCVEYDSAWIYVNFIVCFQFIYFSLTDFVKCYMATSHLFSQRYYLMRKVISPTSLHFKISVPIRDISENLYLPSVYDVEIFCLRKLSKSTHHNLTGKQLLSSMCAFSFLHFNNSFFLLLRFKQSFSLLLANYSNSVHVAVEVQLMHTL